MKKLWYMAAVLLPGLLSAQKLDATYNPGMRTQTGCIPKHGDSCDKPVVLNVFTGSSQAEAARVSDNSFSIIINRSKLTSDEEISIAGKAFKDIATGEEVYFPSSAPIIMDDQSLRNLNISITKNTISAGKYPVTITENSVTITFVLAAAK